MITTRNPTKSLTKLFTVAYWSRNYISRTYSLNYFSDYSVFFSLCSTLFGLSNNHYVEGKEFLWHVLCVLLRPDSAISNTQIFCSLNAPLLYFIWVCWQCFRFGTTLRQFSNNFSKWACSGLGSRWT